MAASITENGNPLSTYPHLRPFGVPWAFIDVDPDRMGGRVRVRAGKAGGRDVIAIERS